MKGDEIFREEDSDGGRGNEQQSESESEQRADVWAEQNDPAEKDGLEGEKRGKGCKCSQRDGGWSVSTAQTGNSSSFFS